MSEYQNFRNDFASYYVAGHFAEALRLYRQYTATHKTSDIPPQWLLRCYIGVDVRLAKEYAMKDESLLHDMIEFLLENDRADEINPLLSAFVLSARFRSRFDVYHLLMLLQKHGQPIDHITRPLSLEGVDTVIDGGKLWFRRNSKANGVQWIEKFVL